MVAAAPLGDVVEQAGQQQQLRLAQARPDFVGDAEALVDDARGEARQVPQHCQRVLIDGVHMEQVELHAAGDARERRNPAPQHAQARHALQRVHRMRPAQQRQEPLAQRRLGLLEGRHARQRLRQRTRGLRMQPANLVVRGPHREQREYVEGIAGPFGAARGQVIAPQFERPAGIGQRHRHGFALDLLLEPLQQALADAQHQRRAAVEALHHLLDGEIVGVVAVAQAISQRLLVIESQPFLALAGHQVQAETQARQRATLAFERGQFIGAELADRHQ